jgi:hypothetical protein
MPLAFQMRRSAIGMHINFPLGIGLAISIDKIY